MLIRKAAVIGAGTMGTGIACQFANAGIPCLLLDVVPKDAQDSGDWKARSALSIGAMKKAAKNRPLALMDPGDQGLVEVGNIDDDLAKIADCDWVVEAVTENLDIKKSLYAKIAEHRKSGTIVSSNTSGISLHLLVDGLDEDFRQHFLVTHFFNPPRYMYLLEIVTGAETKPEVAEGIRKFSDVYLGKGVVDCKDTPNFIANRIGVFAMAAACKHMQSVGLSIEEVDAIAGPPMGRPKTAAFKLHDLVGNDVAVLVMDNCRQLVPHDETLSKLETPGFLRRMVEEGKLGRKAGAGFYKKVGRDILVLDLETFEYREAKKVDFESLKSAKKAKTTGDRIRALVAGDDKAAEYAWKNISEMLLYTARRIPEISDDLVSVDRAVRWGFNWELGPFEVWDALGVRESVERMKADGHEIPQLVDSLLSAGHESFYSVIGEGADCRQVVYSPAAKEPVTVPPRDGVILMEDVRRRQEPVLGNSSASVWDIGDGVLCVEFHSKMNSITDETLQALQQACDYAETHDYNGVVVGNQAPNFSVGANIAKLAGAAVEGKWDDIRAMISEFHSAALRLRYSPKPVVAAVQGMCLGGGCEVPLACDRIQAAAETYIGLVELGVGLIPAGGGTRELACRAAESVPQGSGVDLFPFIYRAFDNIGNAKVSTSAADGANLGFLTSSDGVSMNRDRAIADAKQVVLSMAATGYRPPRQRNAVQVAGAPGIAEIQVGLHQFREAGYISEYDEFIGKKLAYVLCGGDIDAENTVTERYLLDLEREVFVELCGQEKTLQRIEHMLKTGKPLRN
ncbi:MAG: 3-hydroxyacyl-CoA dehydrogenase/enoyl-CoA hydratase family protein [Planctomycetota bacterium]